jgi:hypothetical protein
MARNEPPRWALTANRKSGGVAASQASTFASVGCWYQVLFSSQAANRSA